MIRQFGVSLTRQMNSKRHAWFMLGGLWCVTFRKRRGLLREARPDVSHLQQDGSFMLAFLVARHLNARLGKAPVLVTSIQGTVPRQQANEEPAMTFR